MERNPAVSGSNPDGPASLLLRKEDPRDGKVVQLAVDRTKAVASQVHVKGIENQYGHAKECRKKSLVILNELREMDCNCCS